MYIKSPEAEIHPSPGLRKDTSPLYQLADFYISKSLASDANIKIGERVKRRGVLAKDPPYLTTFATKWHFENDVFNNHDNTRDMSIANIFSAN